MGVTNSPDLANLYGWFFEVEAGIGEDNNVPFYGCYIDDCLAFVYAKSAKQAVQYISNKIKFENCTILWEASKGQAFLDMFLYEGLDGKLEYKPYQKARNHKERIPWISHYPLDVKQGTFIGEMARLATLSRNTVYYKDAIRSLIALYITCGYPEALVMHWSHSGFQE